MVKECICDNCHASKSIKESMVCNADQLHNRLERLKAAIVQAFDPEYKPKYQCGFADLVEIEESERNENGMRYTHYDETIKRWVVKSEEKADGETIGFCVKQEPKEISGINGDVVQLPLASVLVYGEAIDRLAELENAADVVEVVRCKDCKHFAKGMAVGMCKRIKDRPIIPTTYNHYCSYGKRKEQR